LSYSHDFGWIRCQKRVAEQTPGSAHHPQLGFSILLLTIMMSCGAASTSTIELVVDHSSFYPSPHVFFTIHADRLPAED